ncbi:hypothetical protein MMC07_009244 [Pseudocyphellaria aurata]|nr:hypothetical protein [Pseudocyphellaria aurata]
MVRIKHRYLLIQILYPDPLPASSKPSTKPATFLPEIVRFHHPSPNDVTPQVLARAIREQIAVLYGDYGVGVTASSLNVKYLSAATSTAIVRCSRAHYRLVWAALSFMTHLPSSSSSTSTRSCVFRVVRVSGTIKKCEEEAIRRARAAILRVEREDQRGGGGETEEGALLRKVLLPFEQDRKRPSGKTLGRVEDGEDEGIGIGIEDSDEEPVGMESLSDGG